MDGWPLRYARNGRACDTRYSVMPSKSQVELPKWIQKRFPPNERAAVDYLRQQFDEDTLREIADADYSQDTDQHLAALKPIWTGGDLVELDAWFPMEVLELIRWSEPESDDWKPGSSGTRGHQMRAFSCAVLLATPNFEPDKETLIQLLDSVFCMGTDAVEATARFLSSRISSLGREEDRPFFALGMAGVIHVLKLETTTSEEEVLADWVRDEETSERDYLAGYNSDYTSAPWLFGLSFNDMRNSRWNALIQRIAAEQPDRPLGQLLTDNQKKHNKTQIATPRKPSD